MLETSLKKPDLFIIASNSRSRQNKKNPEHPFVDMGK